MNAPRQATVELAGVPVLKTERLILRAPRAGDIEAYVAAHDDPRAHWMGGNAGQVLAWRGLATVVGHWVLRGFGLWAVTERGSHACLGTVGCWYPEGWPEREIGWFVFPQAEGRGIAREAALAVLDHAWTTLGWTTAVSYIHPENARSIALADRLGARRDHAAERPKPELDTLVFRHMRPGTH